MGELKLQIENYLIANPIVNRGEAGCYDKVAVIFRVDPEYIRSIYRKLRKRGLVPDGEVNYAVEPVAQYTYPATAKRQLSPEKLAIIEERNRPKTKLFFDIEVSPNVVFSWRIGYDINLTHENIIQERAIICIGYKWEHESKVHSLEWDNGDDEEMLREFAKIIDSADEIVGQNSDRFDVKWLRTRCLFHEIPISPKFYSIDTLKFAKSGFNFNSNKLDYMGEFLGVGRKIRTEYDLWKNITLENCKESLTLMVDYCKQDVLLLEKVYNKLKNYVPAKKFKYPKSQ